MRITCLAVCAALGMQGASAQSLRIDLGAGFAEQQGANSGFGAQLAATWWVHPRIGVEFMLGRSSGHDGDGYNSPTPWLTVGDVWVDRYAGLGLRHHFAAQPGGWQPFARAGLARVHGIAEIPVLEVNYNPLDPGNANTRLYEVETAVRDTSPYVGFGAIRKFGKVDLSVQLQYLASDFGGNGGHDRTEVLIGLGWTL